MDFNACKVAVLAHLAHPVFENTGRANDQELLGALVFECGHRGDGLDRLAQSHLVTQQYVALVQDVADAPCLVCTELALKPRGIKRRRFNLVGELLGQAIAIGSRSKRFGHQLFE